MEWFGWALAAMGFMGLANLGMKAASLQGLGSASVLFWVVLGELPLALLYWACPNLRQPVRYVLPGAILGTIVWAVASSGFRFYVSRLGAFNKTYGALGAGVVLLLWFYLSGLIALVGGEVNAILVHEHHHGPGPPKPEPAGVVKA